MDGKITEIQINPHLSAMLLLFCYHPLKLSEQKSTAMVRPLLWRTHDSRRYSTASPGWKWVCMHIEVRGQRQQKVRHCIHFIMVFF